MHGQANTSRVLFLISLLVISFGVVFIVRADMGNSPLTAMPYTSFVIFPELSFGNWTIIWSIIVIVIEKVLMGSRLGNVQLLMQLVMSFLFGYFVDLAGYLIGGLHAGSYPMQLLFLIIGSVIMAFGVCLELRSNFTMLAADGLILAVHQRTGMAFGRVKLIVDVVWCLMSLVVGLLMIHGFASTREGTIIVALLVGPMIRQMQKRVHWLSRDAP